MQGTDFGLRPGSVYVKGQSCPSVSWNNEEVVCQRSWTSLDLNEVVFITVYGSERVAWWDLVEKIGSNASQAPTPQVDAVRCSSSTDGSTEINCLARLTDVGAVTIHGSWLGWGSNGSVNFRGRLCGIIHWTDSEIECNPEHVDSGGTPLEAVNNMLLISPFSDSVLWDLLSNKVQGDYGSMPSDVSITGVTCGSPSCMDSLTITVSKMYKECMHCAWYLKTGVQHV